jgi:opacity protein-like surface antigen
MRNALVGALLCLTWAGEVSAQAEFERFWTWSAQMAVSFVLTNTDWSISHPTYSGGGVTWETFDGTFEQRVHLQGSLELRRKYVAFRGTVGFLPQRFTQLAPAQDKELKLVMGGLAAVVYPTAGSVSRFEPYAAAGVGVQKATGDMTNGGFYLSGAAGIRLALTARLALDGGLQIHRLKYTQIELTSQIAKDVATYPVAVFLGARIGG